MSNQQTQDLKLVLTLNEDGSISTTYVNVSNPVSSAIIDGAGASSDVMINYLKDMGFVNSPVVKGFSLIINVGLDFANNLQNEIETDHGVVDTFLVSLFKTAAKSLYVASGTFSGAVAGGVFGFGTGSLLGPLGAVSGGSIGLASGGITGAIISTQTYENEIVVNSKTAEQIVDEYTKILFYGTDEKDVIAIQTSDGKVAITSDAINYTPVNTEEDIQQKIIDIFTGISLNPEFTPIKDNLETFKVIDNDSQTTTSYKISNGTDNNDAITITEEVGNLIIGGEGSDTADYSNSSQRIDADLFAQNVVLGNNPLDLSKLDILHSIENITGSNFNDTILGNQQDNTLNGGEGVDDIDGDAGDDTIIGGKGDDTLEGGAGSDTYIFNNTYNKDTITDSDNNGKIIINNQAVTGTATLINAGTNGVYQLAIGADIYSLTMINNDLIIINPNDLENQITIKNFQSGNLGIILPDSPDEDDSYNINNLYVGTDGVDYVSSSTYSNFYGNDLGYSNSLIYTGVGADVININLPTNNIIYAGDGDDEVTSIQNGNNIIYGESGDDNIYVRDGNNIVYGGSGNDHITISPAYSGSTVVNAGTGDDKILSNGIGNVTYIFNEGDGRDRISDSHYTIVFGEGIVKDDIYFAFQGSFSWPFIKFKNNDADQIEITSFLLKLEFFDGSIIDMTSSDLIISLYGTDGDDDISDIYSRNNSNIIEAGAGNDNIYIWGMGNNIINAGAGNDVIDMNLDLVGATGDNIVNAGVGDDIINGGAGNDTYIFNKGDGKDQISENAGNDTIKFGEGVTVDDLDFTVLEQSLVISFKNNSTDQITISNYFSSSNNKIETLEFSDGSTFDMSQLDFHNDAPVVNIAIPSQSGKAGKAFTYTILEDAFVDPENDVLTYSAKQSDGSDLPSWLIFNSSTRTFSGTPTSGFATALSILVTASDGSLSASQTFALNIATNVINGTSGNDTIIGTSDNDVINGLAGNDTITGGFGSDTIDGGTGTDTVSYSDSTAAVTVNLATNANNGGSAAGDTLANIENITGSSFNDIITGNSSNNAINGSDGDDFIIGGLGSDTIDGGNGIDTVSYADSAVAVTVDLLKNKNKNGTAAGDKLSNIENITGSSFNDNITGSAGNNVINGGNGNDTISAGTGNDQLIGGLGKDTLTGGSGNDIFTFTSLNDSSINSSDLIKDFTKGQDQIDFSGLGFSSIVNGTSSADDSVLHYYYSGSNTIIEDHDLTFKVTLTGKIALSDSDFDFV